MPTMKAAYMDWMLSIRDHRIGKDYVLLEHTVVEGVSSACVVDIYGA